jgi:hypothetical protein
MRVGRDPLALIAGGPVQANAWWPEQGDGGGGVRGGTTTCMKSIVQLFRRPFTGKRTTTTRATPVVEVMEGRAFMSATPLGGLAAAPEATQQSGFSINYQAIKLEYRVMDDKF